MVLAKHLKMLPSPKVAQNLVDDLIKQHSEQSTFFTMLFDQVGLPIMIKSTFFTMLFDPDCLPSFVLPWDLGAFLNV